MNKRYLPLLFVGILLGCALAQAQEVVVIVNNGVKATSASKDEIGSVFTGDKSSLGDGSKVTPVTLKAGAAHEAFLKAYVGKNDAAYRAGWRSLVFTGQGSRPKSVDSDAAMVDYVASTPNAIGYVAKGADHDKVKVLSIK
jgi:hypothetical protein